MTTNPWTFNEESASASAGSVTLVDGTTFLVCDPSGDIVGPGPNGLFMMDTRVLSGWQLRIDDCLVQPLSVIPNGPFSATFVGRVIDPELADAPTTVIQARHLGRGMREDLEIRHFGATEASLRICLRVGSDFGGLFDVKAGRDNQWVAPVSRSDDGSVLIHAPDSTSVDAIDALHLQCTEPPDRIEGDCLFWNRTLQPGETWKNCFLVGLSVAGEILAPSYRCGEPVSDAIPLARLRHWQDKATTFETDDGRLSTALERASEDLGSLRIFDPDHPERVVVAAGAPWFMTLFGRDSLLTSWMALPLDPELAVGVLLELADKQGTKTDPRTEEQPGRILHEVRFDAEASRLLGGSNTYFGTADATPLFVMLVAELARWTGITPTITALMPAVDRALTWIRELGDGDGDGYVEYLRSDESGLENQGWKDSWDGVRHADGSIAVGPIALCEVQGYVYAAYRGRAALARALDEPAEVGKDFDRLAHDLAERFNEDFWLDEQGWYAIGLDGDKRPIGSLTSNVGHLLWTGIVPDDRAKRLARHLVDPSMFTGWGIRTLSSGNLAFNPLSYHCGSVWPHDTAIAVAGLARYRCDAEVEAITEGLLGAASTNAGRLPELFAGFSADDLPATIPYPASCSPQAWAAAAPLMLVRAMLGMEPDILTGVLRLRPRLPKGTSLLRLSGVQLANHRATISIEDGRVVAAGMPAALSIEVDHDD